MIQKRLLKPDEVAALLQVSRSTIYRMVADEELPAVRVRGRLQILSEAVHEMLAEVAQGRMNSPCRAGYWVG